MFLEDKIPDALKCYLFHQKPAHLQKNTLPNKFNVLKK